MSTVDENAPDDGASKMAMAHSAPNAQPSASTREIASMAALSIILFGLAYAIAGMVTANM